MEVGSFYGGLYPASIGHPTVDKMMMMTMTYENSNKHKKIRFPIE